MHRGDWTLSNPSKSLDYYAQVFLDVFAVLENDKVLAGGRDCLNGTLPEFAKSPFPKGPSRGDSWVRSHMAWLLPDVFERVLRSQTRAAYSIRPSAWPRMRITFSESVLDAENVNCQAR